MPSCPQRSAFIHTKEARDHCTITVLRLWTAHSSIIGQWSHAWSMRIYLAQRQGYKPTQAQESSLLLSWWVKWSRFQDKIISKRFCVLSLMSRQRSLISWKHANKLSSFSRGSYHSGEVTTHLYRSDKLCGELFCLSSPWTWRDTRYI